jgi:hypothetical protein
LEFLDVNNIQLVWKKPNATALRSISVPSYNMDTDGQNCFIARATEASILWASSVKTGKGQLVVFRYLMWKNNGKRWVSLYILSYADTLPYVEQT